MPLLEMKNITKTFGGTQVNQSIDLCVDQGEIHALLGENGAGKTTLMNILFGLYKADKGEIIWKGETVVFRSPKDAIAKGIGMVHQHFSLVNSMTVLDNIILGLPTKKIFLPRKVLDTQINTITEKYGLKINTKAKIKDLSVGEQQRVEILKALYRNVELLILDEPTGVLTPEETKQFFLVLKRLKQDGYGIIIITHRMSEIMEISDKVTIIRDGKKIKSLHTIDTNPEELSLHMIGRELAKALPLKEIEQQKDILQLDHITLKNNNKKNKLSDLTFTIKSGEILGIAGIDGNGQKELAELLAGILHPSKGSILFQEEDISTLSIRKRFERGISYISDDRHADGLVLDMNIKENLILREYKKEAYSKKGFLRNRKIQDHSDLLIQKYQIKISGGQGGGTYTRMLSGGNQQKVIIAREVSEDSKCIIANQPTRGLDIGATEFVRKVLVEKRNAGKSVLLISADLEEILSISDRIAVMYEGKIMGILDRKDANINLIGLYMGGMKEETKLEV